MENLFNTIFTQFQAIIANPPKDVSGSQINRFPPTPPNQCSIYHHLHSDRRFVYSLQRTESESSLISFRLKPPFPSTPTAKDGTSFRHCPFILFSELSVFLTGSLSTVDRCTKELDSRSSFKYVPCYLHHIPWQDN